MSKYIKCGKVGLDTGVNGFEQYMQILELRYFRCPVPSFFLQKVSCRYSMNLNAYVYIYIHRSLCILSNCETMSKYL